MTDTELLEAAAKAAGLLVIEQRSGHLPWSVEDDRRRFTWNPLTNDGDALRLAVKLFLWQAVRDGYQHVDSDNDFYSATRRAIVRAAAAVGKTPNV